MKTVLISLEACHEAITWTGNRSVTDAWNECDRGDWMLWLAARVLDRKIVVRAACAVARTSLRYVPVGELRPLNAIKTAERWCDGLATIEEVIAAAAAAYASYAANAANAADYAAFAAAISADAAANAASYASYAAYAAYCASAYAAYCASAASANAAVPVADAAAACARSDSLRQSADIVRSLITAEMIVASEKVTPSRHRAQKAEQTANNSPQKEQIV